MHNETKATKVQGTSQWEPTPLNGGVQLIRLDLTNMQRGKKSE